MWPLLHSGTEDWKNVKVINSRSYSPVSKGEKWAIHRDRSSRITSDTNMPLMRTCWLIHGTKDTILLLHQIKPLGFPQPSTCCNAPSPEPDTCMELHTRVKTPLVFKSCVSPACGDQDNLPSMNNSITECWFPEFITWKDRSMCKFISVGCYLKNVKRPTDLLPLAADEVPLLEFQTTFTHRDIKSAKGSTELSWALVPHHSYKTAESVQTLRHSKTWKQRDKMKKFAFNCRKSMLPAALFMFIFNSFKTSKFKFKDSCNKHSHLHLQSSTELDTI